MSDERRRVLDLLAKGTITTDDADRLLEALGGTSAPGVAAAPPAPEAERPKPRYLRINVHKAANEWRGEKDVNIRVPIAVVRSGMRLGALIPRFAGEHVIAQLRTQGLDVDFTKLDPAAIETVLNELGEANIDIDSGKAQVRITCE